MSPFLSPSFKFNPFGSGMETPPPSNGTFPQLGGSLWGTAICHSPAAVNPPRSLLSCQQQTFTRFLDYNRPGTWRYNPEFGLVHTGTCSTCATYVEHVVAARNYKDTTIVEAIKSRRDDSDRLILDGYRLGVSQMMDENRLLREELEHFKLKWANLRNDYVYLWSFLTNRPITSPVVCPSSVGESLSSPSSSSMTFPESWTHSTAITSPESHTMGTDSLQKSQIEKPLQPCPTYASVASQGPLRTSVSSNITACPSSDPHCGPMVALGLGHDDQDQSEFPETVEELKVLMSLAGEPTAEGGSALNIIKKMCLDAHATPREEKTPIQKWILMNWRNPYSPANANPDVKSNPRIDDPVEVWFDYLCKHTHSWPRGVRKDSKERPMMSDLIANRAVARMRPIDPASVRNDFILQVTDMFSRPGMYQQLLKKNRFTVAPRVTYSVFTGPVTVNNVALHFARSGVTPSAAMNNFEPWAQQYKKS